MPSQLIMLEALFDPFSVRLPKVCMFPSFLQRSICVFFGVVLLLGLTGSAHGQDLDLPRVTQTYAVENAHVIQAPGQVIENATVVVRDGLIEAVGPNVEVPYDAQRIEGDSLYIYAGFIDGLSHAGVNMPESENESSNEVEDRGNPPFDEAGIQPDRSVHSVLDPEESDLESLREVGFTTAHVVPEGDMLPGTGAYVLLGGDSPSDMVLEEDETQFAQISGASGFVYPATDMAVIAQFRQLMREAERRQSLESEYTASPTGQPRPPRDPVHSALFPVVEGEQPMAFYADEAVGIHRVVALHEELNFPLMLAGLKDGFRTLETLQETEGPLFLTLDLPDEPESPTPDDTTVADTTENPEAHYDPNFRTVSHEEVDAESNNLQLRHALEREKYLEAAATLHNAGLDFGFSTREADAGDIRANLRMMIEHGLPEETALSALTVRPARLLGLTDRLGTVEEGKIANLIVTDGPYFDEDTEVNHVFVGGRPYDYTSDAEEGEISGDVSQVVGTWTYTLETPGGEVSGTLTFEGDESGLEGTISAQEEEQDLESISFDGSRLTFTVPSTQGPSFKVSVTIEGDTFEGTATAQGQSFSMTGERTSGPDFR